MKENTLPTKLIAAALECAAKKDIRPQFVGVHIRRDKAGHAVVCATDGHILSVVRTRVVWSLPDVTIRRDDATRIVKLGGGVTFARVGDGPLWIVNIAGATLQFTPETARLPDVYPLLAARTAEPSDSHDALDPAYVLRVAKAAQLIGSAVGLKSGGRNPPMLHVSSPRGSRAAIWTLCVVGAEDRTVADVCFVLMPLRDSHCDPYTGEMQVSW